MIPETKRCPRCGETKEAKHFSPRRRRGTVGLHSYCKPCTAKYVRGFQPNGPETRERGLRYAVDSQAQTVRQAPRRQALWTQQEIAVAMRQDLTAHEVAERLGRTYYGVTKLRVRRGYRSRV